MGQLPRFSSELKLSSVYCTSYVMVEEYVNFYKLQEIFKFKADKLHIISLLFYILSRNVSLLLD